MCGIFGFVGAAGAIGDSSSGQQAVRALIRLSEPRGREATGLAMALPAEIAIYRRPMPPSRVLAHPGFQRFLDETLPPGPAAGEVTGLALVGHCRLVTNGTQAIEANNQPVVHERVVGVHNGIVTNPSEFEHVADRRRPRFRSDHVPRIHDRAGRARARVAMDR
jgi:glucosamine 6-phosphate synthetase-like amidotransferase/phosphosugar isomerase protein